MRLSGDRRAVLVLCATVAAAALLAALAARRTSTTFDEIFLVASGARGWATGDWSMTLDHPPVMQMLYGAAAHAAGVRLPPEDTIVVHVSQVEALRPIVVIDTLPRAVGEAGPPTQVRALRWGGYSRFEYARETYFGGANDPERLAFASRLVGVAVLVGLGAAVAAFAWLRAGPAAALVATPLVVFLPDVLAHAGVAYNDLPLALAYLLAVWAIDAAVRRPSARSVGGAAALVALALGVKLSALALGVVAPALLAMEWAGRRRDRAWSARVLRLLPLGGLVLWLALALVYRGDPTLADFRWGFAFNIDRAALGQGVEVVFLGRRSLEGFWYFFPAALALKTPAALLVLALWTGGRALLHPRHGATETSWLLSPLRPAAVGALVFLVFLVSADLNIGTRHALPILPLALVLVGAGAASLFRDGGRRVRAAVAALVALAALSSAAVHPWHLSYLTELVPARAEAGHRWVVDSSLDWGQGLLALRDWMEGRGVDRVYLSYFGSALPGGYGIDYVPLVSMLPLPATGPEPAPGEEPEWMVVSATTLQGMYLAADPFAYLRGLEPEAVIARSLLVYRVEDALRAAQAAAGGG